MLILDNGSTSVKVGLSGYQVPHAVIPSVVGVPEKVSLDDAELWKHDKYVGDEAQLRREVMKLRHPIKHGVVKDFDDLLAVSSNLNS